MEKKEIENKEKSSKNMCGHHMYWDS